VRGEVELPNSGLKAATIPQQFQAAMPENRVSTLVANPVECSDRVVHRGARTRAARTYWAANSRDIGALIASPPPGGKLKALMVSTNAGIPSSPDGCSTLASQLEPPRARTSSLSASTVVPPLNAIANAGASKRRLGAGSLRVGDRLRIVASV
jgi:hypothetical protein